MRPLSPCYSPTRTCELTAFASPLTCSWVDAALVFLPQVQLLAVLTLVNLPRMTAQAQVSDSQHESAPSGGLPSPAASRPARSPLQRGRRKLAPLASKFSRGSRSEKTSGSRSLPPSSPKATSPGPQQEASALDFLEMLEATPTTPGSVLFQR